MSLETIHTDVVLWLGQRFAGTGIRNVMVVMMVLTVAVFYFTGLYNKIVSRKENKGF